MTAAKLRVRGRTKGDLKPLPEGNVKEAMFAADLGPAGRYRLQWRATVTMGMWLSGNCPSS